MIFHSKLWDNLSVILSLLGYQGEGIRGVLALEGLSRGPHYNIGGLSTQVEATLVFRSSLG